MAYFKHSDVSDSVVHILGEINQEPDPNRRGDLITSFMDAVSKQITMTLKRYCYDQYLSGTPTDVTATRLGISQRAVKRLIKSQAIELGVKNPLPNTVVTSFIDIREHIHV